MLDDSRANDCQAGLDLGRLTTSLGFLLRIAQLRIFDEFFTGLPDIPVKPGEFSVLELIHSNPGARQGQIAEILYIRAPHMTKLIRRLEDQGLIRREIPDTDRRAVELHMTKDGEAVLAHCQERIVPFEADNILQRLTHDDLTQLLGLLQKLTGMPARRDTTNRLE